ncbi:UDP-glucuronosyltransferase 2B13-like [Sitophilus oryzae]|uniref:UDP-glucuronosyltransferase n=1 Tax=Sitophilus oryzae TaxID=7048 RepID=A0A6J2X3G4_SITOR|nr:UDP-glucuronosyltransferase 2B13-like [Sitophilus oryzae]
MSIVVLSVVYALLLLVPNALAYNILVVFSHPGKSHVAVFSPLVKELDRLGHNITLITYVPVADNTTKNTRDIIVGEPMLEVVDLQNALSSMRLRSIEGPFMISFFAHESCVNGLSSPAFQSFLTENNEFDVILFEFFNTNCYMGLANKFKAPFIGLSSCSFMPWHANWLGAPENPAFNQDLFSGFSRPMSFFDRVENTLLRVYTTAMYNIGMSKPGNQYSEKYIGEPAADPHDASLLLVNTHHTLHGARLLTPSIIEVGGIHLHNKQPKKLPEALESWINNSDAGVIYFSLGSMIKGVTFPAARREAFVGAFARLRQRVLWKWENDTMPDKPDNVMIYKWMPQFDILCNPKVKVFISHGGLLGTTEAIQCGVPVIVLPQFGDQLNNAKALENVGGGVVLYLQEVTEEKVYNALQTVLSAEYQLNAKALSSRFKDRPLPAMDTAVYWIEHVARHKGADHMRSPAINLPFYQYFLIDVIAFLALVSLISSYLFFRISKVVLRSVLTRNKTKEKSS